VTATTPQWSPASYTGIVRPASVAPFTGPDEEWDAFVATVPSATFCHLAGWRSVMRDALGHEPVYLATRTDDGALRGVLPLIEVRSRLFGSYLMSMPFLNDGGPLGDGAACEALLTSAVDEARRRDVDLLEIRTRHGMPSALAVSDRKITSLLELPGTTEELWKRFPSKLRSQIRRPQKEGMIARFGIEQLDAFYDLFAVKMRELGTPVLPRRFFSECARRLADQIHFAVVYCKDVPVAAGCGFAFNGEFEITWAGSPRRFNAQSPNMLLYWSLMERMIGDGMRTFNFGRCTPNGPTHRFKRQWNPVEIALPWLQSSPRGGAAAPPSPDRPVFRAATAAWRRLPLPITNTVGPLIARGLP
jgi:FemAB-related protein (PEP-CTERM system-associated)